MRRWSTSTFSLLADVCGVLLIFILLGASVYWFVNRPVFRLTAMDIQVVGNKDAVSAKEAAEVLDGHVRGTFFTADLSDVAEELKKMPWVKEVSVNRVWPNRLEATLYLHNPIAVWGEGQLLGEDGTLFVANQEIAENKGALPKIFGPVNRRMEIYRQYQNFENICKVRGYELISLDYSEFSGWTLRFKRPEGKVIKLILKKGETSAVMEDRLVRALDTLPEIAARLGAEPTELDARYEKGIAAVKPMPEEEALNPAENVQDPGEKNGR